MTTHHEDALERALRAETEWTGPAPEAWRRALDSEEPQAARRHQSLLLPRRAAPGAPSPRRFLRISAFTAAACVALIVGLTVSGLMQSTSAPSPTTSTPRSRSEQPAREHYSREAPAATRPSRAVAPASSPALDPREASAADIATPRIVIRKATIELKSPDVRAAFAKAARIISEARGEFVQDSSLTGEGPHAHATLTLRISVDHLSEALNQLRELGEVQSEQSGGEDVTSRAVDLDARISNERRFESELLQLMESRDDAPLAEILQLRDRISEVRRNIEQMTAQRDRLSGLASLASILVIIRASDTDSEPSARLESYFFDALSTAWRDSLLFIADTAAFLVRAIVGGAFIWIALALAAIAVHRRLSRAPQPA